MLKYPARFVRTVLFAIPMLLNWGCKTKPPETSAAAPSSGWDPKEEIRRIWTPPASASGGYVMSWLICGGFPNPPHKGQKSYNHSPPCVGLDTDYLTEHGGQEKIQPETGMEHHHPEGHEVRWRDYYSGKKILDLRSAFWDLPSTENQVAYAWTTLERSAGSGVLAVGSDDGVKVWLNGRVVHEFLGGRGCQPDQDIVPVTFIEGTNTVLAKVENGNGGWGLCLRAMNPSQIELLKGETIRPSFKSRGGNKLTINTDQGIGKAADDPRPVTAKVVAPGGRIVAQKQTARGEKVEFDSKSWPDGPYQIHVSKPVTGGREYFHYFFWYKGPWKPKVDELLEEARTCDRTQVTDSAYAHLDLLARIVTDRMHGKPEDFDYSTPFLENIRGGMANDIQRAIFEYEELKQSPSASVHANGFVRLSWMDPVDDSPQFARAYLPPHYSDSREWPLIIKMHGYSPPNPPYIRREGLMKHHYPEITDEFGVILVEPYGRGNTDYEGIGESDIMKSLALARELFNVDRRRIYLMGTSMGGTGSWHLGTRHAGTFAAIAPSFGGWDYHTRLDSREFNRLTSRERFLEEAQSSFARAENLLNTPVFVNHGENDKLVDVENSRYVLRMLQSWGYPIRYWEHPGKAHGGLGEEYDVVKWLVQHRLDAAPREVRLRAETLQSARAHWLEIEQIENPFAFVTAYGKMLDDDLISVTTKNALQIRIYATPELLPKSKSVNILWNGERVGPFNVNATGVRLMAEGYEPPPPRNPPAICGPMADIRTTPFAIVQGTVSENPRMKRLCQLMAEYDRNEWCRWQHTKPRFFLDTEIPEKELSDLSLILYGGPEANCVTRKLIDNISLKITPRKITIGEANFDVKDAAVGMIYPNPLNPDRYLLVIAGTSPAGMHHATEIDPQMDFMITEGHFSAGRETPEEQLQVVTGRFGPGWNYNEEFVIRGNRRATRRAEKRKIPQCLTADAGIPCLMLSDVLPDRVSGSFIHMRHDVNWQGNPIKMDGVEYEKGIAVETRHEPCTVQYDLTGCGWKQLQATIGIEVDNPEKLENRQKNGTKIHFVVRDGDRELYNSPVFRWNSPPLNLDVDIADVNNLVLEVYNEAQWHNAASSINWANLRLKK